MDEKTGLEDNLLTSIERRYTLYLLPKNNFPEKLPIKGKMKRPEETQEAARLASKEAPLTAAPKKDCSLSANTFQTALHTQVKEAQIPPYANSAPEHKREASVESLSERATAKVAAPSNDGECPPDLINSEMASYRAKLQDLTENMKNFKKAESLLPGGSWKEALEMENKLRM